MKHDTLELLFANAVRELAASLRHRECTRAADQAQIPAGGEVDFVDKFAAEHPLSEFVPQALEAIERVADQVRSLRSGT